MRSARFVLALAWREGRASGRRLALLTAAVAVGVGALVAIHSFGANLRDSVGEQAKALLGADLALSSAAPFGEKTTRIVEEIAAPAGTQVARVTRFGAMAYVARTSGARLVQVAAVEPSYPFYGVIETEPAGEWKLLAETGGALVDPPLLDALGAQLGDVLVLGEARFPIRATVVNVPGDVSVRTALGPRVFIPASRLDETRLLGFGSRARYEAFLKLSAGADAQRLAERYRAPLQTERVNLRTVSDDQRRLNETLARLARYLGLVALIALLLGGIGVASAVHVFVKRKIETVAVLRCLGASGRQILAAYLAQSAAMGILGSLAGAALGTAVQLLLPRILAGLVPVDVRLAPSWPALAAGVGLGLGTAVLFSLLPLLAVRRISPLVVLRRDYEAPTRSRDRAWALAVLALVASVVALAVLEARSIGMGLAFAAGIGVALGTLALAARALVGGLRRFFPPRLPYLWRQGLANLHRPANQTLAVVLALGFGAFLLGTLVLVQHNLLRDLRADRGARPNLVLFDIQPDQRPRVEAELRQAGLEVAALVPVVPMRIQALKGKPVADLLAAPGSEEEVRGRWALRREYRSTHRDTLVDSERLVAGRWWDKPGEPIPISVEAGVARELELSLGDEVVWDVQGLAVTTRVANLREVEWARFEPNFFVVFPSGPLDEAPQTYVSLTRIEDAGGRARFQRRVVEALPNVSSLDLSQVQRAVEDILSRVALAVRFMALFSLGAGAVVLVGALAASHFQRAREAALLKTLGATRWQVLRIFFVEYMCLGALAGAAGLLLSVGAGWALTRFAFETRFSFPGPGVAGLVLAMVALTVAVGLLSSRSIFHRTPLEVLRAE